MSGKSALSMLTDYGSDTSDDEVPGPRVSTKRSLKDNVPSSNKRLPVPSLFITNVKDENIDDPTLHDGRIRSFAHERGNWATFVYIPFAASAGVTQLAADIRQLIPGLELQISDDFHISLTKTVVLRHHWIQPFVHSVQLGLGGFKKFIILFDTVKVYCNEERTRTFLGLQTRSGHDTLKKLVLVMDKCLTEYKLPCFYENPSFHMSIAWCVGDKQQQLNAFIPQINERLQQLTAEFQQDNWYIFADQILCKTGNKCFKFDLT